MHAVILGMSLSLMGIKTGWQPMDNGGMEYIIQIQPNETEMVFREGWFDTDIPPDVRDIRTFRVEIGTRELPRKESPQPPPSPPAASPAKQEPAKTDASKQEASPPAKPKPDSPAKETVKVPPPKPEAKPASEKTETPSNQTTFSKTPKGIQWSNPTRLPGGKTVVPSAASPGRSDKEASAKPGAEDAGRKEKPPEGHAEKPDAPVVKVGHEQSATEKSEAMKEEDEESAIASWATPLTVALIGLSLGANLYLGWITWETRGRYRALARKRRKARKERAADELPQ